MPTKFLTVVGHPVGHSKSPALHRTAYQALGLDYSYDCVDVEQGGLVPFIESYQPGLSGLSVTMPLKREALAFADEIDWLSRGTEAVNTLVIRREDDGEITHVSGFNTDVHGIAQSLRDAEVTQVNHAAIVGAGATASSAVAALSELGAEHIDVFARNVDKAQSLNSVAEFFATTIAVHPLEDLSHIDPVSVAISTLPGTEPLSLHNLPREARAALLDVAYDPWPSARGVEWEIAGGISVSGLRMLAHQAVIQARYFTSGDGALPLPHEEDVRRAMFEAVGLD